MHLFELAQFMAAEGNLPPGIPTCWPDVQPWIEANGWRHPGGIPVETLDRFAHRLQTRLDWAEKGIPE